MLAIIRPDILVTVLVGLLLVVVACYIMCINAGDIDKREEELKREWEKNLDKHKNEEDKR